jgi:hypothetical protein
MRELGYQECMTYNLGTISDAMARRIAIELNETRFATDQLKLAEAVKDILTEYPSDELELTMPYSKQELDDFPKMLDFDWDDFKKGQGGEDGENGEAPAATKLSLDVSPEALKLWNEWKERCRAQHGVDTDSKALELALIEALNVPAESVG